uniref:Putative ixodes 10 kDa peptide protein n=1 Tax=Ixodes ricinus TaxID=34613 RepID=A0A0K8RDZ1_IXORI
MCRNISNMLFVLFAVVLCLAASKGEVSQNNPFDCYRAVITVGDILCKLYGYHKSTGLGYQTCKLACEGGNVQLPEEACSNGGVQDTCTQELKDSLQKWSNGMMERNEKIWCKRA